MRSNLRERLGLTISHPNTSRSSVCEQSRWLPAAPSETMYWHCTAADQSIRDSKLFKAVSSFFKAVSSSLPCTALWICISDSENADPVACFGNRSPQDQCSTVGRQMTTEERRDHKKSVRDQLFWCGVSPGALSILRWRVDLRCEDLGCVPALVRVPITGSPTL